MRVPKYNVYLLCVVGVWILDVEAEDQPAAVLKAQEDTDLSNLFRQTRISRSVEFVEFTDEVTEVLVDEVGDGEHKNSKWYLSDGTTFIPERNQQS